MNAPLRRVGILMLVLFGLLFANLNWVQAYKSDEYRTSPHNCRNRIADHDRPRGLIAAGRDAEVVAVSSEVEGVVARVCTEFTAGGARPGFVEVAYLREYPFGELYAHVVGYQAFDLEPRGIERYEAELLAGVSNKLFVDRFQDLFSGDRMTGGNVVTTLSHRAQQVAFDELGNRMGAVVALDPRTGAVQTMVSTPSFEPEPLASPDRGEALTAFDELNSDRDRPLVNRAVRTDSFAAVEGEDDPIGTNFHPGSVMKVIVAAAALANGYSPDTSLDGGAEYLPPTAGSPIRNAPGVVCPNQITLRQALTVSCNTAFSRLAAEEFGSALLTDTAAAFGVGTDDLRVGRLDEGGDLAGTGQLGNLTRPDGQDDPPILAQTAIGQASVVISPLQGALIAAAVVNGGVQMRPYVVDQLQGPDLRSVYTASPEELRRSIPADVAGPLQDMMVSVVAEGTGRNAQIPGVVVGGKTGTAETGVADDTHGWFIGFAIVDGVPVSAVAVMLENAGSAGSGEATRIAGEVLRAVIEDQGGG